MSTATGNPPAYPDWARLQRGALVAAGVGLALTVAGAVWDVQQFARSYLVAFTFWLGIGLGSLVVLMLQYVTGGAWGVLLRRILESGSRTLVLMAVLFIPLAVCMRPLYLWANPESVEHDPAMMHKAVYLNIPFFLIRTVGYFAVWVVLALVLSHWSRQEEEIDAANPPRRYRLLSSGGLVLYGLTITFASIDWVMSLEPRWYSTIYPVLFATGQVLNAFAFAVAAFTLLAVRLPNGLPGRVNLRDLGSLLLAFVMLWAYMSFSQFLLIWVDNVPDETPWYLRRLRGGWEGIGIVLILFHFFLPFFLLLSRDVKENPRSLAAVAVLVLILRFIDVFWWIEPAFNHDGQLPVYWLLDLAAWVGLGGLWLWTFLWQLKQRPLLPANPGLAVEGHHD